MKRAHSPSPSTSDDTEPENRTEREASPSPEAKTKAAGKAKSPRKLKSKPKPDDVKPETDESDHKPPTLKKARAKDTSAPGEWTAEKRETLVERIFENGYKNTDVAGLAAELGLKTKQVMNQLTPNRKSNLRDKCVRYAGTEMK